MMGIFLLIQDTVAAAVDTVVTTPTLPPVTDLTTLIQYWVSLAAGLAAGYVVKLIQKLSTKFAELNNFIQTFVLATVSFGVLKLGELLGISLPGNPFEWNEAAVSTIIATGIGLLIVKLKKEPTTPTEPTP